MWTFNVGLVDLKYWNMKLGKGIVFSVLSSVPIVYSGGKKNFFTLCEVMFSMG